MEVGLRRQPKRTSPRRRVNRTRIVPQGVCHCLAALLALAAKHRSSVSSPAPGRARPSANQRRRLAFELPDMTLEGNRRMCMQIRSYRFAWAMIVGLTFAGTASGCGSDEKSGASSGGSTMFGFDLQAIPVHCRAGLEKENAVARFQPKNRRGRFTDEDRVNLGSFKERSDCRREMHPVQKPSECESECPC